jgi:two-component system chemotaxis response regulator CheY
MTKILIIDDEALIRSLLKKSLKDFGDCVVTENGKDGLSVFENAVYNEKAFDIIFLDIMMEGKNGLEVLKEIRSREKERKIPRDKGVKIIMITGNAEAAIVKTCITEGCDKFIVKPFVLKTLSTTLEDLGFKSIR